MWKAPDLDQQIINGEKVPAARTHHDFQREGNPVGYYAPNQYPKKHGRTLINSNRNVHKPEISPITLSDTRLVIVDENGKEEWSWQLMDHFDQLGLSETAKNAFFRFPGVKPGMSYAKETYLDNLAMNYHTWIMLQAIGMGIQGIKATPYQIYATTAKEMFPEWDLRRESYFYKLDELSDESHLSTTGGLACPYVYKELRVSTSGSGIGVPEHYDYNWVIWRLADIYLLRAECRARLNKNAEAIADLNEIRKRANAKLYDASEYGGDLRFAIFKEREKELLFEGHRYYDVIRNGYARRVLSDGFRQASDQDFIDGCFFYAIADGDFTRNPLLRQNTWWHKYM